MWSFLYKLASPAFFYRVSTKALWLFGVSAIFFLACGLFWGLFLAPPDYLQGDAFRIIYLHVPSAFLSLSLYAYIGFLALLVLVWRIKIAGLLMQVVARLGAMMALIALVTGSIWGKPTWGTWWIWDARLTSELILFFLYCGLLITASMYRKPEQADRAVAILALVGLVDLPMIHYSVYWWSTLHQGQTLSLFAKPKIASSMLYPLLMSLVGFLCYSMWYIAYSGRTAVLARYKRQQWVQHLVSEESRG